MRATIVVDDNMMVVDGEPHGVDCTPLVTDDVHAVQWYDSYGEVEHRTFVDASDPALVQMTRKPNKTIVDFAPYQTYLDQWTTAKAAADAEAEAFRQEQERLAEERRETEVKMKAAMAVAQKAFAKMQAKLLK